MDEKRNERVLLCWVNLPEAPTEKELAHLESTYPKVFRNSPIGAEIAGGDVRWKLGVREHLRAAWHAPSHDEQQRIIYALRRLYGRFSRMNDERMLKASFKEQVLAGKFTESNLPSETRAERVLDDYKRLVVDRDERLDAAHRELDEWGLRVEPPPPVTLFDSVLKYFQNNFRRALHCPNPACRRPYFFKSESKRTQTYCSDKCSRAVRLATKAQWWNDKGRFNRKKAKEGK
jgi:hypothetical protein